MGPRAALGLDGASSPHLRDQRTGARETETESRCPRPGPGRPARRKANFHDPASCWFCAKTPPRALPTPSRPAKPSAAPWKRREAPASQPLVPARPQPRPFPPPRPRQRPKPAGRAPPAHGRPSGGFLPRCFCSRVSAKWMRRRRSPREPRPRPVDELRCDSRRRGGGRIAGGWGPGSHGRSPGDRAPLSSASRLQGLVTPDPVPTGGRWPGWDGATGQGWESLLASTLAAPHPPPGFASPRIVRDDGFSHDPTSTSRQARAHRPSEHAAPPAPAAQLDGSPLVAHGPLGIRVGGPARSALPRPPGLWGPGQKKGAGTRGSGRVERGRGGCPRSIRPQ